MQIKLIKYIISAIVGIVTLNLCILAQVKAQDLSVVSSSQPVSGCSLTSQDVTIKIFNFGISLPAGTSFNVSYTVNAAPPVTELVTLGSNFLTNGLISYTFVTKANLSVPGNYALSFSVFIPNDLNPQNNTLSGTVITNNAPSIGGTISPAVSSGVAGSNAGQLTLNSAQGSVVQWEFSEDGGLNWQVISNTTISQNYSNLTHSRTYRALVKNGICAASYSSSAVINIIDPTSTPTPTSTATNTATSTRTSIPTAIVPSPTPTAIAPVITPPGTIFGKIGLPINTTINISGSDPISLTALDSLPPGLFLVKNSIVGVPIVLGQFSFTLQASNAAGTDQVFQTYVIGDDFDTDGDGIPDAIEDEAGSVSTNYFSTPFNADIAKAKDLAVNSLKAFFSKSSKPSSVIFKVSVLFPAKFDPSGHRLTLALGFGAHSAVLNKKGIAISKTGKLEILRKKIRFPLRKQTRLLVKLSLKGSAAELLLSKLHESPLGSDTVSINAAVLNGNMLSTNSVLVIKDNSPKGTRYYTP